MWNNIKQPQIKGGKLWNNYLHEILLTELLGSELLVLLLL
jgi:hypothetical protein